MPKAIYKVKPEVEAGKLNQKRQLLLTPIQCMGISATVSMLETSFGFAVLSYNNIIMSTEVYRRSN